MKKVGPTVNLPIIVSLLFFAAYIMYVFFSIYILMLNHKARINRVFFFIPFFMSIWAFAFAIANSAPSYEIAFFWRRVASFGWGVVFSSILHFMLVLRDSEKDIHVAKKRYFFLYVPSVFNLIVFGINTRIAEKQYNLVLTKYGWTNVSVNNWIDQIYNIYYVSFTVAVLVVLALRMIQAKNKHVKIQSIIMIATFAFAFVIGSITDIFFGAVLDLPSIQIGPIIILLPVVAFYIAIKRFGMILSSEEFDNITYGDILTVKSRLKIIQYLALIFTLGSLLSFAYQYYFHDISLLEAILYNGGFLIFGFFLYGLPLFSSTEKYKDFILMIILTTTIPYAILRYADYDASITIWSITYIFIILSILFTQKRLLQLVVFSSITTMFIILYYQPTKAIVLKQEDHYLRIFFLLVASSLAYYVQKVYIQRLRENEKQVIYQQLLSTLSGDVLLVTKDNSIYKMKEMFEKIGKYTGFDRVYLLQSSESDKVYQYTHEWSLYEYESTKTIQKYTAKGNLLGLHRYLKENDYLYVDDLDQWIKQTITDQEVAQEAAQLDIKKETQEAIQNDVIEFMMIQKARSVLFIPVKVAGEIIGFFGMDNVTQKSAKQYEEISQYKFFANIISDLIQKIVSEIEIHTLAYYDNLTKLPNRILMRKQIEQTIHNAQKENERFAVLFIDLDTFKLVNDTIGHAGGDALLVEVAGRINDCLDEEDLLCRFSGDEFVVLTKQDITHVEIESLAHSILEALRQKIRVNHNEFTVTSSIGIAIYPEFGENSDSLIKNSDFAMYEAKLAGKNQFKICTESMLEKITYKNKITVHLKKAIENNEFEVFYQPQVNVLTEEIIGLEALLRWTNTEFGSVPPSVFIPIAEQSGLIKPIGEWVFRRVCEQYRVWKGSKLGSLRVAINLSSDQFRRYELLEFITKTIQDTDMNPELLEIEITESVAIRDVDETIEILNELKAIGIRVSIDDFGTEYSSLSRLKDLPIDRVKIAMNFIHGITIDPKDEAIVNVIIYLSKSLGLSVIAEGVESIEQLNYLKEKECDDIQGYYFYRPMPIRELEKIIA